MRYTRQLALYAAAAISLSAVAAVRTKQPVLLKREPKATPKLTRQQLRALARAAKKRNG